MTCVWGQPAFLSSLYHLHLIILPFCCCSCDGRRATCIAAPPARQRVPQHLHLRDDGGRYHEQHGHEHELHEFQPPYQSQRDRFAAPLQRLRTAFQSGSHDGSSNWFSTQYHNLLSFFIATWLDWLTLLVIGATAAGVWVAPHTFTRLFPITDPNSGTIYWPELAYPYLDPVFSAAAAGIIAAVIPIVVFAGAQLWLHSFRDFSSAVLGLGYSMITGTLFQVILKKTIGESLLVVDGRVDQDLERQQPVNGSRSFLGTLTGLPCFRS